MKKADKKAENKKDTKKNKGGEGAEGGAGGGEDDEHESMSSSKSHSNVKQEKGKKRTERRKEYDDDEEEEEVEEESEHTHKLRKKEKKEKQRKMKEEEQEKEKQRKKKKEEQEKEKQRKKKEEEDTFWVEEVLLNSCIQKVDEKTLSEDIKTYFFHQGVYGDPEYWPQNVTVLYYKLLIEGDDDADLSSFWRIRNTDVHAEDLLLQKLELVLREKYNVKLVDIFLSYSPCHECVKGIVSFLNDTKKEVKLSIKIANFYKHSNEDNIKGLCLLINSGVDLSVFSGREDWVQFYKNVTGKARQNVPIPTNRTQREAVDATILERLQMIAPLLDENINFQPHVETLLPRLFPLQYKQADISNLPAETESFRTKL